MKTAGVAVYPEAVPEGRDHPAAGERHRIARGDLVAGRGFGAQEQGGEGRHGPRMPREGPGCGALKA